MLPQMLVMLLRATSLNLVASGAEGGGGRILHKTLSCIFGLIAEGRGKRDVVDAEAGNITERRL